VSVTAIRPTPSTGALSRNGDRRFSCDQCGGQFEPTRSDARYCSSPCRQRAYRRRTQSRVLDVAKPSSQGNGAPPRLTAETRQLLRVAIDRCRRELLTTPWNVDEIAALRALFAEDGAEA
jgi:hypothetical protein